jgi:hypothetical protein
LLTQYGNLFPADELRDLFILALNFCIRQYNAGSSDYLAEQFELYKEGFSKDFLSPMAFCRGIPTKMPQRSAWSCAISPG